MSWWVVWFTTIVVPLGMGGDDSVSVSTGVLPTTFVSREACQEAAGMISAVGEFDLEEGIRVTTWAFCTDQDLEKD